MTSHQSKFSAYLPYTGNQKVFTMRGETLLVTEIGTVLIYELGVLENVLHVPKLQTQILSPQH